MTSEAIVFVRYSRFTPFGMEDYAGPVDDALWWELTPDNRAPYALQQENGVSYSLPYDCIRWRCEEAGYEQPRTGPVVFLEG